jgi:uncharacterized peroxidase-related enzyme
MSADRVATISMVDDAAATAELKEIFKHVEAAMGRVPNLARVIAHSPPILGAFMQLAGTVAMPHKVPMDLKELAVLRVAELNGCPYCAGMHRPMMRQMGISEEKIEGIAAKRIAPSVFSETEVAILDLADEMTENVAAKPETVARVRGIFGEDGTVELMMTIAFYNLMTRLTDTSGVPLEQS